MGASALTVALCCTLSFLVQAQVACPISLQRLLRILKGGFPVPSRARLSRDRGYKGARPPFCGGRKEGGQMVSTLVRVRFHPPARAADQWQSLARAEPQRNSAAAFGSSRNHSLAPGILPEPTAALACSPSLPSDRTLVHCDGRSRGKWTRTYCGY